VNIEEYIASGDLELYVAGELSEQKNQEIHKLLLAHPALQKEVEEIEQAIQELATSVSPSQKVSFQKIKDQLKELSKVIQLDSKPKRTNWLSYTGWAAAILFGFGLLYMYNQNNVLNEQIKLVDQQNEALEQQIADANEDATKTKELNAILRAKEIISINLAGQKVAPESFAKVFWNKNENTAYIDAAGLPDPPPGKVYQVWSLTLNPLSPTSLGLLSDFVDDENKVFNLSNANASEAFGITLEPAGGSETPTMDQLYTLGAV